MNHTLPSLDVTKLIFKVPILCGTPKDGLLTLGTFLARERI